MEVRDRIQRVFLEHRGHYGVRRITRLLRREGRVINHKRVERLMKEDNLLGIKKRQFVPVTTESEHELPVYLNLAKRMEVTGVNQLWVADLTYIRLRAQFVYLAVVIDAYSRRVVGWAVSAKVDTPLTVWALQQAIQARQPKPGLVHHSDRGVQYASRDYVEELKRHDLIPSMSRPGNPYDNAFCESFMKTLKKEEVHCSEYRDIEDLARHIEQFIDNYYNQKRLHSALGYCAPAEFEANPAANGQGESLGGGPKMRYFQAPGKEAAVTG